ncbi:MAG: hypothetical protein JRI22_07965, partial [Deltaproteobacteria bacterium]|nr:hypothetical protein [Deltaproteobacteria bacterium]
VLAYHLLASIQRDLKNKGISHRWSTIRTQLATHMRTTVSLTNDQGERIHIRQTTDPEPFHDKTTLDTPCGSTGRKGLHRFLSLV